MNLKFPIIGIIFYFSILTGHCQSWIRIYSNNFHTVSKSIFEYYDKGYILSGDRYPPGYTSYGWVLKIDVNGYEKWSKMFGNSSTIIRFFSSKPTSDDGVAHAGLRWVSSGCSDPLIIKTNACGEKEWCKIYNAPHCSSTCYDIAVLEDGGYIALMDHWKSDEEETIWLFRLDSNGGIIWAQAYATDTSFASEWSHSLLKTNDSCVVITGEAYFPDPTYPNLWIIKIILIKVDNDGESIFEVPWGPNNGIYSKGYQSIEDAQQNIYTAGEHPRTTSPGGDSPCMFKTNSMGNPVNFFDLMDTTSKGTSSTIDWFSDSTMALGSVWGYYGITDTTGVIKTDRTGTLLKTKPLLTGFGYTFNDAAITFNNSLIITGGFYTSNSWKAYAFKLTSDLEYDSIYTTPFTYDSLCPHPIISDTIPLDDCEVVIVNIDEAQQNPETTKLHIYPTPSASSITIEMPKYLIRRSSGAGITATTTYHQWKETRLDVFDLYGRLMFSRMIPQAQKIAGLDVSPWSPGMYVARLVFMDEVVGRSTFIVAGNE